MSDYPCFRQVKLSDDEMVDLETQRSFVPRARAEAAETQRDEWREADRRAGVQIAALEQDVAVYRARVAELTEALQDACDCEPTLADSRGWRAVLEADSRE